MRYIPSTALNFTSTLKMVQFLLRAPSTALLGLVIVTCWFMAGSISIQFLMTGTYWIVVFGLGTKWRPIFVYHKIHHSKWVGKMDVAS